MSFSKFALIGGFTLFVLFIIMYNVFLQEKEYTKLSDLTIQISTEQKEIIMGEPLLVTIKIKNDTKKTILINRHDLIDFTKERSILLVAKPNQGEFRKIGIDPLLTRRYEGSNLGGKKVTPLSELEPSKRLILQYLVIEPYPFNEQGVYKIKFKYTQYYTETESSEEMESNTIEITVKKPGNDSDEKLSKMFLDEKTSYIKGGIVCSTLATKGGKDPKEEIKKLLKDANGSVFRLYIKYFLARLSKEEKEAIPIYEEIIKDKNPFVLRLHCYKELAQCYKKADKEEDAKKTLETLKKLYPDNPAPKAEKAYWMR